VDPRDLTVPEIAGYLAGARRVPGATLRRLAGDRRASVGRLLARYRAAREAERRERLRLRALYRQDRRRAPSGRIIAGVDEVGRGPLAGPVFAAAVILDRRPPILGLDDSKRLTPEIREALDAEIRVRAVAVAVGEASVAEIDRFNILGASLLAMRRALDALVPGPQFVLVDGRERLPGLHPHATVVKGDALCASIAAASIVAKVARDRAMCELHQNYPSYGFVQNKGYGTREHVNALLRFGPCPAHRRAFLRPAQLPLIGLG
jgi:ribonuclease HII